MEIEAEIYVGTHVPFTVIDRAYLLLESFGRFAFLEGDRINGQKLIGAYGVVQARMPNPDAPREMQSVKIPIQNKSDFKSICRAHIDRGVQDGSVELVLMYLHQPSVFSKKASFHVAAFPAGVWERFFEAVSNYQSQSFVWPKALFLYQPTSVGPFHADANSFRA